jgi:hypothetical protein
MWHDHLPCIYKRVPRVTIPMQRDLSTASTSLVFLGENEWCSQYLDQMTMSHESDCIFLHSKSSERTLRIYDQEHTA